MVVMVVDVVVVMLLDVDVADSADVVLYGIACAYKNPNTLSNSHLTKKLYLPRSLRKDWYIRNGPPLPLF